MLLSLKREFVFLFFQHSQCSHRQCTLSDPLERSTTDNQPQDTQEMASNNSKINNKINNIENKTAKNVGSRKATGNRADKKTATTSAVSRVLLTGSRIVPRVLRRCFRGIVAREWWSVLGWAGSETVVLIHLRNAGASGWLILSHGAVVGITVIGHTLGAFLASIPCFCRCRSRGVLSRVLPEPRWVQWAMAALTVPLALIVLHVVKHGPPTGVNNEQEGTEKVNWCVWDREIRVGPSGGKIGER